MFLIPRYEVTTLFKVLFLGTLRRGRGGHVSKAPRSAPNPPLRRLVANRVPPGRASASAEHCVAALRASVYLLQVPLRQAEYRGTRVPRRGLAILQQAQRGSVHGYRKRCKSA